MGPQHSVSKEGESRKHPHCRYVRCSGNWLRADAALALTRGRLDSYTCDNVDFVLVFWGYELDVSVMRTLMDDTA